MSISFGTRSASAVETKTIVEVDSSEPAKIHKVPKDAAVKVYPVAAGSATLYSTNTTQNVSKLDVANADITGSVNASWDMDDSGTLSAKTIQITEVPVETVALVVDSGVWNIEISV